MGRAPTSQSRLLKYKLLRFLPGQLGRHYKGKHRFGDPARAFDAALLACKNMRSIDLGANLGEYTRRMAAHASHVIAFEPDPWTHEQLRKSVGALPNVQLIEAAAGLTNGHLPFYRHGDFDDNREAFSQSGSLLASKANINQTNAVDVEIVDFPAFLRGLDGDVGVLKMDIEGAEVDLLEALLDSPDLLARIHYIFAETHESRIPEHAPRVKALRDAALKLERPAINLFWH